MRDDLKRIDLYTRMVNNPDTKVLMDTEESFDVACDILRITEIVQPRQEPLMTLYLISENEQKSIRTLRARLMTHSSQQTYNNDGNLSDDMVRLINTSPKYFDTIKTLINNVQTLEQING